MEYEFAEYDRERDLSALTKLWQEIGWIQDDSESERRIVETELTVGPARVARINGTAESLAIGSVARLQYLNSELSLAAVTAVTTSLIARKRGLARQLTARLVADMATNGAGVAMLGIFDQGFYDHLGFGTGPYDHRVAFQPSDLNVPVPKRMPCRLTAEDWEQMHECQQTRLRNHGAVTFDSPQIIQCQLLPSGQFGWGFRDETTRRLTHFLWCRADDREDGPYRIIAASFRNYTDFLELLGLLKSLGDQIRLVTMIEPVDIQMQDLLDRPFLRMDTSSQGKFATGIRSFAPWQARICNLSSCISACEFDCQPLRFNLDLHDPITQHLPDSASWPGIGGQYTITIGPESTVEPGVTSNLPTLQASVAAFTRLWLGVRSPSGLAVTDDITAPEELLTALDVAMRLPKPSWDWRF